MLLIGLYSKRPNSKFNYNSRMHALIPENSPDTQKRLDGHRHERNVRKQEREFQLKMEKIQEGQQNKAVKEEHMREFEIAKLLEREQKMARFHKWWWAPPS